MRWVIVDTSSQPKILQTWRAMAVCFVRLVTWRERDGDSKWDNRIRALVRGLDKIAVHKKDYAYYPDGGYGEAFTYPKSGWRSTREPMDEHEGGEGSATAYQGHQSTGFGPLVRDERR